MLDALVDYGVEPDDPARIVPNPERRRLDKEIGAVRQELAKLQRDYGAAAMEHQESKRPTLRGFKLARRSGPPGCDWMPSWRGKPRWLQGSPWARR
jgi:hypothetical protein